MSLQGNSNEEKIWNYLKSKGLNDYCIAGILGNLRAESGLNPKNLQNSFESKLGLNDNEYTLKVDNGSYTNFVNDKAGYGLAQWTYWTRKQNLLNFVKSKNKSIGDLEIQLDFLWKELSENYKSMLTELKSASSVFQASNIVLMKFEKPADQSKSVQEKRAKYCQEYYEKYSNGGGINMSNSSLVNITIKSPHHSGKRTHTIDRITPHCVVGQLSASALGNCFTGTRKSSCNYGISKSGEVVLCVDEANRSWCSSNQDNDQRAVTIECASDATHPYAMNDSVYNKLVELCTDICKRNRKKKLIWFGDKTKTLNYSPKSDEMIITVHRWFANKACPGDWLYNRLGQLASTVTNRLGGAETAVNTPAKTPTPVSVNSTTSFKVKITATTLRVRKGAGTNYPVVTTVKQNEVYTITETKGNWGKLKSGVGWISLEYAQRI